MEHIAGVAGDTLHLAAGAAHQESKYPKRALYGTFDGRSVTVFPIRYEDSPTPVWTVDPSLFPREPGYKKRFFLPGSVTSPRSPAALVSIPQPPDVSSQVLKELDSLLLLPESGVVPFHALRLPMRDAIVQWALDDEPIMLRLQAGEGGSGKTRLLIEVCKTVDALPGWSAGFFKGERDAIVSGFTDLQDQTRNCLIVVDFAETKSEIVVALTRTALDFWRKGAVDKVRIVLLARDGGDWWNNLSEQASGDTLLAAYLHEPSKKQGPYRMSETVIEAPERLAVFREALTALAAFKHTTAPNLRDPDLTGHGFAQPLYLHLAALAVLRGEEVAGSRELLRTVLGHERQYWRELLGSDGKDEERRKQFEQCLALVTLVGGAQTAREARDVLKRSPLLRGRQQAEVDQVFDRLRRLYPWDGGVGPLRPDALGEQLVAEALSLDDEMIDVVLGRDSIRKYARNALTVLTRMASRDPEERKWLERALRDYLGSREQEAREVGEETGPPMDEILAAALRAAPRPTRRHAVNMLRSKLPKETMNLKLVAMEIGSQRVEFLKEKHKPNNRAISELVEAHEFLGRELARGGKLQEALVTFREGHRWAERFRRSSASTDRATFASALNNFSNALGDVGRFADALAKAMQAEEIYRELAEKQPDAYRAGWAASLNSLANRFGDVGRFEDALAKAEQAEEIRRDLAEKQPDAYRADWALSLGNLAIQLGKVGRFEDALAKAEQAEEIRRDLAEKQPDAYRADWAHSLGNLAIRLGDVGRFEDALAKAEQAEEILRDLAEKQPDAYRADWAHSLGNLAVPLGDVGRFEDALAKAEQAEEIRRDLAEKQPDAYRADWAHSLGNLAIRLGDVGRFEDALAKAEQAEEILRDLAEKQPDAYRADWAHSLGNLAVPLGDVGRFEDALAKAEQAEEISRDLAEKQPDAYRADWALSLGNLAIQLGDVGRFEDALAKAEQAEEILRELAEKQPDAYRADWALSLANLAEARLRMGETCAAMADAGKAEALLRPVAERFPNVQRAWLGFALRLLAEARLADGDAMSGSVAALESTSLFQALFAGRGGYECDHHGKALVVLARCQSAQREKEAAVATLTRAVEEIGGHFRERPRPLDSVMRGIVTAFREIDAEAAARLIPTDILETLRLT
ncbi:MAG: tetratricopeptide repeat protein [Rhodospirillales bacterium]|nr:tetratricopeptide repeat protein [Rhodospirillales bacterium]